MTAYLTAKGEIMAKKIVYLSIFEQRHHKKAPSAKFVRRWYKRGGPWWAERNK